MGGFPCAAHAAYPGLAMVAAPIPLITVDNVSRNFGAVRALNGVSLEIAPGQRLGLVGHNGAGKSTLMNVLLGAIAPSSGRVLIDGNDVSGSYTVAAAFRHGVRCVFQELSLCGNLSAYENLKLQHAGLRGVGWRRRAADLIQAALQRIFPGNTVDVTRPISSLSIAERQMVEIARAFTSIEEPTRLVILDEPTSSLDSAAAIQLTSFIRTAAQEGVATIFISHRLNEIIESADDIVVMADGAVIAHAPASTLSHDKLVELMSGTVHLSQEKRTPRRNSSAVVVEVKPRSGLPLRLHAGEVVGLAGLDGHGQRELLHRIFRRRPVAGETIEAKVPLAFVSGDRQREGIFPLWPIRTNLTIGAMRSLGSCGILPQSRERALAEAWRERLGIRAASMDQPILSLSGGNQQKVLIARAFASEAPVVLLDDPTRGVDITTKRDLYEKVRRAADSGRSFLWYTTEFDELEVCDRVYVLSRGAIAADLDRDDVTEDRVIDASFRDVAAATT